MISPTPLRPRAGAANGATPRGVFGYGSLMNGATHGHARPRPATLAGWRRLWRHAEGRPAAFLTIEPAPGAAVEGAVAEVELAAWPALDAREAAYERHEVGGAVTPASGSVVVYAVAPARHGPATPARPVLLSYLDVVVQGAMRLRGEAGAAAFFDTTGGWGAVLDDRAAPRYVRAQALTAAERAAVDAGLARLGVVPVQAGVARVGVRADVAPPAGRPMPPTAAPSGDQASCRAPGRTCRSGMRSAMSGPRSRPVTAWRSGRNNDLPLRPVASRTRAVHSGQVASS